MRALVVDDSSTMRNILRLILEGAGHAVVEAKDGMDAVQYLKKGEAVGLMLLDWNMPNMDGLSLLEHVRSDSTYDDVPVMMVTTEAEMSNVVRALQAGANEYIMKPFTPEALCEKLALLGIEGEEQT